MGPGLRKVSLTAHVILSVGWLGAVLLFLVLALIGLKHPDAEVARASIIVMEPLARLGIVPLALGSLTSGLVMSLGTSWGLFRHWWVIFKLVINVLASVLLILYLSTLRHLSQLAAEPGFLSRSGSPVIHASGALALLVIATCLAVFKPKGLTRYGWRRQHQSTSP